MTSLARITLVVAFALGLAGAASGQRNPHGLPQGPRPLQERLPAAVVVVIGRIDTVEEGRVRVRTQAVVRGIAPESFEIKRSPARPPRLGEGDTALLLLRGARSPYILVDHTDEVLLLADEQDAAFWTEAVTSVASRLGDQEALLSLYSDWIDGSNQTLRGEAARAILFQPAGFLPLPAAFVDERVAVALDSSRPDAQRTLSARIASTDQRGLEDLVAAVPAIDDPNAAGTFTEAIRIGNIIRLPAGRAALLRGLRHPAVDVQLVATSMSQQYASDPEVLDALVAAAGSDNPDLSQAARRVIDRASRQHP